MPSDLVFIIDSRGDSFNPIDVQEWRFVTTFLRDLVARLTSNNLDSNIRIGVIQYTTQARSVYYLNYRGNMADSIGNLQMLGSVGDGSNVAAAIDLAINDQFSGTVGDRIGIPNVAVVLMRGRQLDVSPYLCLLL